MADKPFPKIESRKVSSIPGQINYEATLPAGEEWPCDDDLVSFVDRGLSKTTGQPLPRSDNGCEVSRVGNKAYITVFTD